MGGELDGCGGEFGRGIAHFAGHSQRQNACREVGRQIRDSSDHERLGIPRKTRSATSSRPKCQIKI